MENVTVHTLSVPQNLEEIHLTTENLLHFLSTDEHERYSRFLVKKKQVEFVLARAFTKTILGKILNKPTADIKFGISASGKPFLKQKKQPRPLFFNISHTTGVMCCVTSLIENIGIDVEQNKGPKDDLVTRYFHPREIEGYNKLPAHQRSTRFYTIWTLKEAYLKAMGYGLTVPLNSFWFSLPEDTSTIKIHFESPPSDTKTSSYQLELNMLTDLHILSVAAVTPEKVKFLYNATTLDDFLGTVSR